MELRNTATDFGALAKLFHWTSAATFIGAYLVVYYLIWFVDEESAIRLPVLNVHWALGLLTGVLVLPRLVWRLWNRQPAPVSGSRMEHLLAQSAHWMLYALMIVMPLTGYMGTGGATSFGLFTMPSFRDTALFGMIAGALGVGWEEFEAPLDAIHHFLGKLIAWAVVGLHVAAALFHHFVRNDDVLRRMLPRFGQRQVAASSSIIRR